MMRELKVWVRGCRWVSLFRPRSCRFFMRMLSLRPSAGLTIHSLHSRPRRQGFLCSLPFFSCLFGFFPSSLSSFTSFFLFLASFVLLSSLPWRCTERTLFFFNVQFMHTYRLHVSRDFFSFSLGPFILSTFTVLYFSVWGSIAKAFCLFFIFYFCKRLSTLSKRKSWLLLRR